MVTGFFVVMLGIFTTIAILSHDARLTELESNQASICSAVSKNFHQGINRMGAIFIICSYSRYFIKLDILNFQTRTFGNLVLPEATTATTASINVAINAINNFATPSC